MTNLNPELLKKQLDIMEGEKSESELIEKALDISLRKGLNRNPYPFEIPINFRENRENNNGKKYSSIEEYFNPAYR